MLYDTSYGYGGGIFNAGRTLTVSNCTLSGNSASAGAGIFNDGSRVLTIVNSTLSGNSAFSGGGIYNYNAALTVSNCTLSGNSATADGGGMCNNFNSGLAPVTIMASTFSSNSADTGGGMYNLKIGGITTLTIGASTFSGNSAGTGGGGIYNDGGTLEIGDTILNAGGSKSSIYNNAGTITSDGYNLSSDAADGDDHSTGPGGLLNGTGDIRNTDPMLGPLADNGGPTLTHALLPGSPAIDHGNSFDAVTDQRGFPRSVEDPCIANAAGGDGSDIGAFEVQQVCRPVDFRVTAIKRIGNSDDLRLSYTTVLGSNYVVQARSNLVSGSWSSLPGTNVGIGVVMQSIVTNALDAPQGFYRTQQLP